MRGAAGSIHAPMGRDRKVAFISPNGTGVGIAPSDLEGALEGDFYTTIAFDPGGRTGWAVFQVHAEAIKDDDYRIFDNITFWSAGEFYGALQIQVDEMMSLVEAWPEAHIVIEDFVLRKFSSARELLDPVRITERFEDRIYVIGNKRAIIKQPPSLAMNAVT